MADLSVGNKNVILVTCKLTASSYCRDAVAKQATFGFSSVICFNKPIDLLAFTSPLLQLPLLFVFILNIIVWVVSLKPPYQIDKEH